MSKTTQERVADTILQRPKSITIGGHAYSVAPPTIGTLVIVSEYLSRIPEPSGDKSEYIFESLRIAKDCKPLAYAIAAIIIGAKHWEDKMPDPTFKPSIWRKKAPLINVRDYYADIILKEVEMTELADMMVRLFNDLEIADFFGCITFLRGVNLTKATKVTEATQSGR